MFFSYLCRSTNLKLYIMDYAKVEKLWNEYKNIQVLIGDEELTLKDVFQNIADGADVTALSEFNAFFDDTLEENPELTDDKEIVLETLLSYLFTYYYDNHDEGEKVLIKLGDEVLYEDTVEWSE